MQCKVLDHFEDLSSWTSVASGQASIHISQDQGLKSNAMRVDFDFKGGGGFVVIRKSLSMPLPETWAFIFNIKGHAPANKFEFKLVDRSGLNVWWFHRDVFEAPNDWQAMRIGNDQVEYAWGPDWGEILHDIGAIELVIAAGPGGSGTFWIEDLCFEEDSQKTVPRVQASGFMEGFEPEKALDGLKETCWKTSDDRAQFRLDFNQPRELGGLVIQWKKNHDPFDFELEISEDGLAWKNIYRAEQVFSEFSYVYLPETRGFGLRLNLFNGQQGFSIVDLTVKPYDFSRSIIAFFQALARNEPKGRYPKYLYGEQTYWTPFGVANGVMRAIMNEEGMAEIDYAGFSIEPFLFLENRLLSWADVTVRQELEQGFLPMPSSVWEAESVRLKTTGFASGEANQAVFYLRYRLENLSDQPHAMRFFAAIRPFQVTPPWQSYDEIKIDPKVLPWKGAGKIGGVSPITDLAYADGVLKVNDKTCVMSITKPDGFGALRFQQGAISEYLASGSLPPALQLSDSTGQASGAFAYSLELAPGGCIDIYLAVPSDQAEPLCSPEKTFENQLSLWKSLLEPIDFSLPPQAADFLNTFKSAIGHILINRKGPALHPGPRRYMRSWIRDGAIMASALLMADNPGPVKDFIDWYAGFQKDDGAVPCCVDERGPDWLVELDSQGEFIFVIAEYFRMTHDADFLARMWPLVLKDVAYIDMLQKQRLTADYQTPEKRACFGLLPESVSHEGYLSHPVHAYWDDFWALRGLKDAVFMAEALGDRVEASKIGDLLQAFQQNVYASIRQTMLDRHIDYIPGSVEWADCDPSATAVAIAPLDEWRAMPKEGVESTFATYLQRFRDCRSGAIDWPNYTAYEIRIIPAMIRMGKRLESHELFDFFLSDRRPLAWNQWPEISWKNPKSPGHIGDMPHTWIAAEYVLAFRTIFAYESQADASLVLAAGIPLDWLSGGFELKVQNLKTHYGKLNYSLCLKEDGLSFSFSGDLKLPKGGIVLKPPLSKPIAAVEIKGQPLKPDSAQGMIEGASLSLHCFPAEVKIIYDLEP